MALCWDQTRQRIQEGMASPIEHPFECLPCHLCSHSYCFEWQLPHEGLKCCSTVQAWPHLEIFRTASLWVCPSSSYDAWSLHQDRAEASLCMRSLPVQAMWICGRR